LQQILFSDKKKQPQRSHFLNSILFKPPYRKLLNYSIINKMKIKGKNKKFCIL